ncbi:thermonuclease family protein [Enterococcus cecorum]|uniref:thermonuclease family protein n=1 Tax=Enterococcus cecorum TaxID=44008 RepID=UPI001FAE09C1|nr:thermonuclease family protein [Enterococcus cecorum]MCJ0597591.1 thermonuclease family protein [Enterococcus cecorum]
MEKKMKKRLSTMLLTALSLTTLALTTSACSKDTAPEKPTTSTVKKTKPSFNYDKKIAAEFVEATSNDQATFIVDGKKVPVKFIGIYSPSLTQDQPLSKEANQKVNELLKNADYIQLQFDKSYGHQIKDGAYSAYVWLGNELLQTKMLTSGLAILSGHTLTNSKLAQSLETASTQAKKNNAGAWAFDGYVDGATFNVTAYQSYQKNQELINEAEQAIKNAEANPTRDTLNQANAAYEAIPVDKRPSAHQKRIAQVNTAVETKEAQERQAQEAARKAEEERKKAEEAARLEQQRLAEQQAAQQQQNQQMVWIAPQSGRRYHFDPTCRGLRRANSTVQMTLQEAQAQGYTHCGYE